MSRYFEEFQLGEVYRTRGRTITESDVVTFAGLSGDFVELHVNIEHARSSRFGQRIAHGALILSISTGLVAQLNLFNDTVIAFYGVDRLRFTRPVFIGDTIYVTKRVAEVNRKREDAGTVAFETVVANQEGNPVLVYRDLLMIKRAPIGADELVGTSA